MADANGLSEEQLIDAILELAALGKVVPVVGRRLSLTAGGDGTPVPLYRAVAERLAAEMGVGPLPPGAGLTEVYTSATNKHAYNADAFHPKLKRVLQSMKPVLEPLAKIAEIAQFKLFLSTAIDGFLERAVRQMRGGGGETVRSFTFAPGYPSPRGPLAPQGDVCVYNLLGTRDTCPAWAVTVENLVEFVLALQSEKYRPQPLFDALRDHHLLAIGCEMSDWLGGLVLRSLHEGPISTQHTQKFLVEDASALDTDREFVRYLRLFSKDSYIVHGNPCAFVDALHGRWKERFSQLAPAAKTALESPEDQSSGKVFISYSHADRACAQKLRDFLVQRRVDVWMDDHGDDLEKGGDWDHVIERQIARECSCFVALVSRNTEEEEAYFWKEWNLALRRLERRDPETKFIFPVLCEQGVAVPDQFRAMQYTLLSDGLDLERLADILRKEQQHARKERRQA